MRRSNSEFETDRGDRSWFWSVGRRQGLAATLFLMVALLAGGCLLVSPTAGDFQTFVLFFDLSQELPEGQTTEVHSMIFPNEVKLKGQFVRISGRIDTTKAATSSQIPGKAVVNVTGEDRATGKSLYKVNLTANIKSDGSFSVSKKLKKNIDADTLQTVTIVAQDGDIPAGSRIGICVDIAKKKGDLTSGSDCGTASGDGDPPASNAHVIQVVDNRYEPKSLVIQPGDTVRWELTGDDASHTVTAMDSSFNSGFVFTQKGAFFERTFPASSDGSTFEYSCTTHRACCQMQGSIRVGSSAPSPLDGY